MTGDAPGPFADRALADLIGGLAGLPPMTASGDVAALRRSIDERSAQRPPGPTLPTTDLVLGEARVAARHYRPDDARDALIVHLHGGGWTVGGLASHDRACRRLAARSRVPVLAVDYRLAPEHPAPAAVDDAVEALRWATTSGEGGRRPGVVAIGGDSAGGTLAALAAIRARGTADAADLLVLVYANTDLAATGGSMDRNAHGYGLDVADVAWFNAQWVPDRGSWVDPSVSPLRVPDLSGLPEAIVVTCELDPLRDQGEAFAHRLAAAGSRVLARRELAMVHNFLLWDLVSPACAAAADRVADDLAAAVERLAASAT